MRFSKGLGANAMRALPWTVEPWSVSGSEKLHLYRQFERDGRGAISIVILNVIESRAQGGTAQ
jgi:hypothetical protein